MKREIAQYKMQIDLLEEKSKKVELVITSLEERDDKIYREIFGAAPIDEAFRKAGIGGNDRYKTLKNFDNSKTLVELHESFDQINRRK